MVACGLSQRACVHACKFPASPITTTPAATRVHEFHTSMHARLQVSWSPITGTAVATRVHKFHRFLQLAQDSFSPGFQDTVLATGGHGLQGCSCGGPHILCQALAGVQEREQHRQQLQGGELHMRDAAVAHALQRHCQGQAPISTGSFATLTMPWGGASQPTSIPGTSLARLCPVLLAGCCSGCVEARSPRAAFSCSMTAALWGQGTTASAPGGMRLQHPEAQPVHAADRCRSCWRVHGRSPGRSAYAAASTMASSCAAAAVGLQRCQAVTRHCTAAPSCGGLAAAASSPLSLPFASCDQQYSGASTLPVARSEASMRLDI